MDLELSRLNTEWRVLALDVGVPDAAADSEAGSLAEDGIRCPKPFRLEGMARRTATGVVVVAGHVVGEALLECDRCLTEVRREVDVEFDSRFRESSAAGVPRSTGRRGGAEAAPVVRGGGVAGEEASDVPDDEVTLLPEGATAISLVEVVREQVLLDLPFRRLCSADCKGLCQHCEANLNAGPCACASDPPEVDQRLGALLELRRKLERS